MNNEDSGNELFGISEQLREKKHDPDCDCGICQYCNGTEDVYGNSTAPIKIANLEAEIAHLREKLVAAEEKRDMWLRIAQRLFKERQTMLHGHVYDLPTDDVILEATILETIIARAFGIDRDRSKRKK